MGTLTDHNQSHSLIFPQLLFTMWTLRLRKVWLEQAIHKTPPRRLVPHFFTFLVNEIPVELTAASINIHLSCSQPSLALPEVSGKPESSDNKEGEVRLEKVTRST